MENPLKQELQENDFQTPIYEYIRSIETMIEAVEKQPEYPFDSSLTKSYQILEHIHRQMKLLEGIRVTKKTVLP